MKNHSSGLVNNSSIKKKMAETYVARQYLIKTKYMFDVSKIMCAYPRYVDCDNGFLVNYYNSSPKKCYSISNHLKSDITCYVYGIPINMSRPSID